MIVFIMRGTPGCGKTTWCKRMGKEVICSADDFFVSPAGVYKFDSEWIESAHNECVKKFQSLIESRSHVIVVDNPNMKKRDYEFYILEAEKAGYTVEIINLMPPTFLKALVKGKRNIHGISEKIISEMYFSYEP